MNSTSSSNDVAIASCCRAKWPWVYDDGVFTSEWTSTIWTISALLFQQDHQEVQDTRLQVPSLVQQEGNNQHYLPKESHQVLQSNLWKWVGHHICCPSQCFWVAWLVVWNAPLRFACVLSQEDRSVWICSDCAWQYEVVQQAPNSQGSQGKGAIWKIDFPLDLRLQSYC